MVKLSPSRIKTLLSCSWIYYCKYILKTPDTSNSGAARGSTVHPVLESLLNKKHKRHVEIISHTQNAFASEAVYRLARMHAKKLRVYDDENMKMINDFIVTAINFDFYMEGAEQVISEKEIEIITDKYHFGGFIDKLAIYPDKTKIVDYKSSKAKFTKDDLDYNLQSLMYSLAVYKMYPHLEPEVEFLFLKFKKAPQQYKKHTIEELKAAEAYLEHIGQYLSDFGIEKAHANFAADKAESKWLCGKRIGDSKVSGEPAFICSMKYPFIFFVSVDPSGRIIKSSRKKEEILLDIQDKVGYTCEERRYEGCPRFKNLWEKK